MAKEQDVVATELWLQEYVFLRKEVGHSLMSVFSLDNEFPMTSCSSLDSQYLACWYL
jgi:hypothetical protein